MNPVYWPEVRRGSERFARELADGLIARGHAPTLICGHAGWFGDTDEDGLRVLRVPRLPEGRLERRGFERHLTHVPFAVRALRGVDAAVVHALYAPDAAGAARTGRPLVFSYMGIPHRTALVARRKRLELTLEAVRGAGATVVLSRAARDAFVRWLGVEAHVIAPGVDLDAFSPDPSALALDPTIVCSADPNEPRKQVALLVEAFGIVRRSEPRARLILDRRWTGGGEGIEARDLDDRAALAAANREAWVAALPSWGEAFGLVLLEALACGTPVVGATGSLDAPDAIARPFDGDDPEVLARALLEGFELARDPGTAAAGRAHAERFSWDATVDAYLGVYDELLSAG